MRFARLIPIVVAALSVAAPAVGQDEKPKDHPRFSGMPTYEIANRDEQASAPRNSRSAAASCRSTSKASTGRSTTP
jgi:hypothetical protein